MRRSCVCSAVRGQDRRRAWFSAMGPVLEGLDGGPCFGPLGLPELNEAVRWCESSLLFVLWSSSPSFMVYE